MAGIVPGVKGAARRSGDRLAATLFSLAWVVPALAADYVDVPGGAFQSVLPPETPLVLIKPFACVEPVLRCGAITSSASRSLTQRGYVQPGRWRRAKARARWLQMGYVARPMPRAQPDRPGVAQPASLWYARPSGSAPAAIGGEANAYGLRDLHGFGLGMGR
jgi:hypothetical protein